MAEDTVYEATTVPLHPGDCVFLFTDGVSEAKNKTDNNFGNQGILSALKSGPMTTMAMGQRLLEAVKQHAKGCHQHDDITVVGFGRV